MARKKKSKESVVSFRCGQGLIRRLEKHADRLRIEQAGSNWTRSSAALNLVLKALDQAEAEAAEASESKA